MSPLRILHIAPELAPLSGEGDEAEAARALCRGVSALRPAVQVVAATFHDPGRDPERFGLARRLEPIPVSIPGGETVEVPVHEGLMSDGSLEALVADCGAAAEPVEVLTRLALEQARHRDQIPHAIHVSDRVPQAVLVAREMAPAVPVLMTVSEPLAPPSDALRAALRAADRVVVGSPSLARQILAGAGELASALADPKRLRGLVPGIDVGRFNPERDPHLSHPYSAADRSGKAAEKRALQRELNLPPRTDLPLVGAVGPFDLLDTDALPALADLPAQFAFVLDPERDVDAATPLVALGKRFATRVAARELARGDARERAIHRLLAAADFWLVPRPPATRGHLELGCLAYGTIPIAPAAGAFADVLVDYDPPTATGLGFLFPPEEPAAVVPAVRRAARAFSTPGFPILVERAMRADLGWKTVGRRILELYREMQG